MVHPSYFIGQPSRKRGESLLNIRLRWCADNHHVNLGNFEFPREFECKCGCGMCEIDLEVWLSCQLIRQRFNTPAIIRSGCRCDAHNRDVGGADDGDHKYGWAADLVVPGVPSPKVAEFAEMLPNVKRIGVYEPGRKNGPDGFVHIGVRDRGPGKWRRWRYDSQRNSVYAVSAAGTE